MSTLNDKTILFLIKTMDVGGAERLTLNLCKLFQKYFKNIIVFSTGGLFENKLTELGIVHLKSNCSINRNIFNALKLKKQIKQIIKLYQPHIVHCQHRIFLLSLRFIKKKNFRVVYTANTYFNDTFQKLICTDVAIAVSSKIEENLLSTTLLGRGKIKKINTGVKIYELIKTEPQRITFGYVGRIIPEKGIMSIINTVEELSNEGIFIKLFIRGDGEGKTNIQVEVENRHLEDCIRIEGPYTDLNVLYNGINALILPSLIDEGLPISILEAISRNILVITTKSGGIGDIIEDRITGFILKDNSPEELSLTIKYILSHKEEVNTIKNNAYKILQNLYSMEQMFNGYYKVYEEVLF